MWAASERGAPGWTFSADYFSPTPDASPSLIYMLLVFVIYLSHLQMFCLFYATLVRWQIQRVAKYKVFLPLSGTGSVCVHFKGCAFLGHDLELVLSLLGNEAGCQDFKAWTSSARSGDSRGSAFRQEGQGCLLPERKACHRAPSSPVWNASWSVHRGSTSITPTWEASTGDRVRERMCRTLAMRCHPASLWLGRKADSI